MQPVPTAKDVGAPNKKMIYINPNFRVTPHINPLFMQARSTRMIHMNPNFLDAQLQRQITGQRLPPPCEPPERQQPPVAARPSTIIPPAVEAVHINPTRRKLVRRAGVVSCAPPPKPAVPPATAVQAKALPTTAARRYKLDRRPESKAATGVSKHLYASAPSKKPTTAAPPGINKQKVNERRMRLVNINGVQYRSTYNKLQRKDERSHKCLASSGISPKVKTQAAGLVALHRRVLGKSLFVSGSRFLMDSTGFRLTRVPATSEVHSSKVAQQRTQFAALKQRQRIDVAGLTFVASAKTHDVWVCTRNHLTMAHLNSAKHRSLQLLTRHLVKSNVPCAIFQRLGKCIAYERGKCNKVHDKKQVVICPKFLQGDCGNARCLLSHNVSLSKMPVCKFYLQGVCVRPDCPYLHKKLSRSAEICTDFLRGFCRLADQCNKRHEFTCPSVEQNGQCATRNCPYCSRPGNKMLLRRRKETKQRQRPLTKQQVAPIAEHSRSEPSPSGVASQCQGAKMDEMAAANVVRYFSGAASPETGVAQPRAERAASESDAESDHADAPSTPPPPTTSRRRPKLGSLPAFIPLS